jgi:hypothetical protein
LLHLEHATLPFAFGMVWIMLIRTIVLCGLMCGTGWIEGVGSIIGGMPVGWVVGIHRVASLIGCVS